MATPTTHQLFTAEQQMRIAQSLVDFFMIQNGLTHGHSPREYPKDKVNGMFREMIIQSGGDGSIGLHTEFEKTPDAIASWIDLFACFIDEIGETAILQRACTMVNAKDALE